MSSKQTRQFGILGIPPNFNLDRKLEIIKIEIDKWETETLLQNVDPSIDELETINQIQSYYTLINKEMILLKRQETEEKEYEKKIKEQQKAVEELENTNNFKKMSIADIVSYNSKEKRKPTMDYKIKLRILEKDLHILIQNYNNTKAKNETLKSKLNEMRKNSMVTTEKLKSLTNQFQLSEKEYMDQKDDIERKLVTREDNNLLLKINEGEQVLKENNDILISQIKSTDKGMTQKLAYKKFLDNEMKKLEEKEKKIDVKWENERKRFYEINSDDIQHCQSYDPSSKVLEILDEEKISKLEVMLGKMYDATNLNSIDSLVDYFIKCTKEFNNFEDFIYKITHKVTDLEKEVEELEFIINFCEQNLEIKYENNLDDDEKEYFDQLKKAGQNFTHLQYQVILDKYKHFCEVMTNIFQQTSPELNLHEEEPDFMMLLKRNNVIVQEKLREALSNIKEKFAITTKMNNKHPSLIFNANTFDFSEVDNKYLLKSDKIKETVKKEMDKTAEKGGRVINLTKIKSILDSLMNEEK